MSYSKIILIENKSVRDNRSGIEFRLSKILEYDVRYLPELWGEIDFDKECVIINNSYCCLVAKLCLTLATPWNVAHQAFLSMRCPREEHWSG